MCVLSFKFMFREPWFGAKASQQPYRLNFCSRLFYFSSLSLAVFLYMKFSCDVIRFALGFLFNGRFWMGPGELLCILFSPALYWHLCIFSPHFCLVCRKTRVSWLKCGNVWGQRSWRPTSARWTRDCNTRSWRKATRMCWLTIAESWSDWLRREHTETSAGKSLKRLAQTHTYTLFYCIVSSVNKGLNLTRAFVTCVIDRRRAVIHIMRDEWHWSTVKMTSEDFWVDIVIGFSIKHFP